MLRKLLGYYGYEHLAEAMDDFGLSAVDTIRLLTEMYEEDNAPIVA